MKSKIYKLNFSKRQTGQSQVGWASGTSKGVGSTFVGRVGLGVESLAMSGASERQDLRL